MLTKFIICALASVLIGAIFGGFTMFRFLMDRKDGEIILDKNDEGNDRIIFALGMEYDEIAKYDKIIFNVVKKGL